ncbi:MAG: TVP38/TMEM64 family protein [Bacteroidota bacterium]
MSSKPEKSTQGQSKWPLIISGIIIGAIILSYFIIPEVNRFFTEAYEVLTSEDEERISAWVDDLGVWGPLFIIISMTFQMFLLVIPSPLLIIISVLAFGPLWGSLLAILAIAVASTIGFFIGKYISQALIIKLIGKKKEKKLSFYVNRYGIWAVFITRITPLLSNDAISFVSGILHMNYWKFIGATIAGITPLVVLIAWFGQDNDRLRSGLTWISVISIIILVVYIIIDRKKNPVNHKD